MNQKRSCSEPEKARENSPNIGSKNTGPRCARAGFVSYKGAKRQMYSFTMHYIYTFKVYFYSYIPIGNHRSEDMKRAPKAPHFRFGSRGRKRPSSAPDPQGLERREGGYRPFLVSGRTKIKQHFPDSAV